MKLKILSWNIWINGDFQKTVKFLEKSNADIIGLQEVVANDPKRDVIGLLTKLGYEHLFTPVKKTSGKIIFNDGPALFSKYKIKNPRIYNLSEKDSRSAVSADISINGETLHIFNTHLIHTHQENSNVQEEQIKNLIKKLPSNKTIVMGDFNSTPQSSTVAKMKQVLVDSDSSSAPTWSIYPGGCRICNPTRLNTKLDYIFTSKEIKTSNFKVENSKASDHLPISVIAEI